MIQEQRSAFEVNVENAMAEAVCFLSSLINTPSFSGEEEKTADLVVDFFKKHDIPVTRVGNNVLIKNFCFDEKKPTILLNSHHDTVRPSASWTLDPFNALHLDGKLFGLGSNDAGGCLVSLIFAFLHFFSRKDGRYNLLLVASAEEENSGPKGISMVLPYLKNIKGAVVGEPTSLQMAVAEKGLLVLDCVTKGRTGHAAREEGDNAIVKAMEDLRWFNEFQFPKVSEFLGPVKMSVTSIWTENKAHNVVPGLCTFVVDVRLNELYTHEEVLDVIRKNIKAEVLPRSMRIRSSAIEKEHPLVKAGSKMGLGMYGSPTTSDKALMPFPALKIGPGDSARSHTANEFIYIEEIRKGIHTYIHLLNQIL
jgi:acetylornithine deacetylase